ncbi:MAG: NUDIX domain-containing protein [Bacteroidales bacterium]|nr:NUDIX domain-containing protein [Candidatus Cryptobacteroides aphodequi]
MIELIYPFSAAPVLGTQASAAEMLPVVEPNGVVVAQASRFYCHKEEKPLHPVVHMHLMDRYSRFFLQKRSSNKTSYPGLWDIAVGGHVIYGEMYEEALYREAAEELGLFDFNPQYFDNYIYESAGQHELVNVYATIWGTELHPDNYEVCDGRFWTIEEIEAAMGTGVLTPILEKEFALYKDRLVSLL